MFNIIVISNSQPICALATTFSKFVNKFREMKVVEWLRERWNFAAIFFGKRASVIDLEWLSNTDRVVNSTSGLYLMWRLVKRVHGVTDRATCSAPMHLPGVAQLSFCTHHIILTQRSHAALKTELTCTLKTRRSLFVYNYVHSSSNNKLLMLVRFS